MIPATTQPLCSTLHSYLSALPSDKRLSPSQVSQLLVTLQEPQISLSAYALMPFATLQPVLPGSPGLYGYCCPPCPKDTRSRSAFWSATFLPSTGPVSTQLSCGSLPSKGQLSGGSALRGLSLSPVLVRSPCASSLEPGKWVVQMRAGWDLPAHSPPHPTPVVAAPCSVHPALSPPHLCAPNPALHSSGDTCLETAQCLCRADRPQEINHLRAAELLLPSTTPGTSFVSPPRRFIRSQAHQAWEGCRVRTGSLSHEVFELPLAGKLLPANLHPAPWQVGLWDQGRRSQSDT